MGEVLLSSVGDFFGSKAFAAVAKPGRRRDKFLREKRARVYPPGMPRQRAYFKGPAKSGIQPTVEPSHGDAIFALRASIPSPPEVMTKELESDYRKLMNARKAMRRLAKKLAA